MVKYQWLHHQKYIKEHPKPWMGKVSSFSFLCDIYDIYPLVNGKHTKSYILKMAIEIVDLPIKHGDFP